MSEPAVTTAPVESDPTYFKNHYPTLMDLLMDGGRPGVEYCQVCGSNQRSFAILKDDDDFTFSLVDGLPPYTVEGPRGKVDTVVLMGRGKPIEGAGDFNGIRKCSIDIDLEEATGIPANPQSPITLNPLDKATESVAAAQKPKPSPGITLIKEKGKGKE